MWIELIIFFTTKIAFPTYFHGQWHVKSPQINVYVDFKPLFSGSRGKGRSQDLKRQFVAITIGKLARAGAIC
jgi:hypothetical protein